jgi:hypothetical protein
MGNRPSDSLQKQSSAKLKNRTDSDSNKSKRQDSQDTPVSEGANRRNSPQMENKDSSNKFQEAMEAHPVVDAVVVDEGAHVHQSRIEAFKQSWNQDELYSPQWLFAIVKRHDLVDEASLKILMQHEYDLFLVKKFGEEKMKELGISEESRKNLMRLAESKM